MENTKGLNKELALQIFDYLEFVYPLNGSGDQKFDVRRIKESDKGSGFTPKMFVDFFNEYFAARQVKEKYVIRNCYMMFDRYVVGMTLSEIAIKAGLTQERVRQITGKYHEIAYVICGEYK